MSTPTAVPLNIENRDGMRIFWDVPIVMEDGVTLRGDVYLPTDDGRYPVIASLGAYGKNYPFQQEPYTKLWDQMIEKYPEVAKGTTGKYTAWEVVDPEKWVPMGYAVLRIDSRGAGRSEGFMRTHSLQESIDFKECIEWAAGQPWSNGKVGLSGISYYAVNQWMVAGLEPDGLSALCIWEGASDWYRDVNYHGGIPCSFLGKWFEVQAKIVQYGLGSRGPKNPVTGIQVAGDVDLSEETLKANRGEVGQELKRHPFDDEYYADRSSELSKVKVPLLSAGNWGGQALHGRSNLLGFVSSASEHKWLEVHGGEHWTLYYTDYGLDLQRRFFDYFLKGEGDWVESQPRVLLQVRHPGERFVPRAEQEWPLERTEWTPMYLDPAGEALSWAPVEAQTSATYQAFGEGLHLLTSPFEQDTEVTGPVRARIFMSSSTTDADLFVVLRLFEPGGEEVLFQGANEPKAPITQGWLRASHREVDPERSLPWMPFHPHQVEEPLEPDSIYELDIEIWPTCIVIPVGYRLGFSILGRDFDHGLEGVPSHIGPVMRGSGFWYHEERPAEIFDNEVTIYGGGGCASRIVLPVIPATEG